MPNEEKRFEKYSRMSPKRSCGTGALYSEFLCCAWLTAIERLARAKSAEAKSSNSESATMW
ncbi:hypothetical protein D3C72_2063910 [compost metagenome]